MNKCSFILYNSYLEQAELLSMEQRGELFTAILNYANGLDIQELDAPTMMAFSFIKKQLDADTEKYEETCNKRKEAGKLGGRPPKANGLSEKAKKANGFLENQTKAKKPDNEYEYEYEYDLKEKEKKEKRFSPPTVEEVKKYAAETGKAIDAERFVDFYASKNWMVGKNKMKDWKAAVRNWIRQDRQGTTAKTKENFPQRNYDYGELNKQWFGGEKNANTS